jgi:hypothetical protein
VTTAITITTLPPSTACRRSFVVGAELLSSATITTINSSADINSSINKTIGTNNRLNNSSAIQDDGA